MLLRVVIAASTAAKPHLSKFAAEIDYQTGSHRAYSASFVSIGPPGGVTKSCGMQRPQKVLSSTFLHLYHASRGLTSACSATIVASGGLVGLVRLLQRPQLPPSTGEHAMRALTAICSLNAGHQVGATAAAASGGSRS